MEWFVDEYSHCRGTLSIRGWAFHPAKPITRIEVVPRESEPLPLSGYGLPSDDVVAIHGTAARNCRFAGAVKVADPQAAVTARLFAVFGRRDRLELVGFTDRKMHDDPFHSLFRRFIEGLREMPSGHILEIGSRNRSGAVRRGLIPPQLAYTGMDIVPGENVDMVGDAHELRSLFPPETFDAIFAMSTVEHLLMPWKFAIEANHILKPGGLIVLTTHQTWALHERPWDFWRFSNDSWAGLFNRATGFEILETAMGEPASIVPHFTHPITSPLEREPAYLTCAVKARKTGKTTLEWPVTIADAISTSYPR